MNSHGHVAGFWMQCDVTADEAFYWTPETGFVTMPRPDGVWSARASDINDHGLVIGGHAISGLGWKAFVYDIKTGEYEYLEPKHDGVPGPVVSSANAINNAGIVAGSRSIQQPGEPNVFNAVIWDTNTGEVTDLGVMNGPNSSGADGNSSNDVAGWSGNDIGTPSTRAILWTNLEGEELGVLPGMIQSQARRLNSELEIIGSSGQSPFGPFYPFYWHDGKMALFQSPEGYHSVGVSDINDSSQIVGHMKDDETETLQPFLWQHEEFYPLVDLIVDIPSNVVVEVAGRVGNDGRVLARVKENGKTVAAMLTPTDQPLGDFNHDCTVDIHDLLILISEWGSDDSHADLNGDGTVGVPDLLILLGNWGG